LTNVLYMNRSVHNASVLSQIQIYQWQAHLKSQSYIKVSNLLFSNPKSQYSTWQRVKCVWLSVLHQFQSQQENKLKPVNSTGETTKHWKGLMSNNQQWFGCQISWPKSNCKNYRIKSNPNRRLSNWILKLLNHSQKVLKSRYKSRLQLGFAHHWNLPIHRWFLWLPKLVW